jgi:hypothetical protein
MSEEIIDQSPAQNQEAPQAVKTLAILSIVGSSLWGLIILILMFMFLGAGAGSFGGMFAMGAGGMIAVLIIILLLMIGLNVGTLIASVKMMKGNKKAFTLYAVCNGIWALLILLGAMNNPNPLGSILVGLISAGFIVAFGMQMKNMN